MNVVRWSIGLAMLAYCAVPAMAQSSIQTAFNYDFQEDADAVAPPAPGTPAPAAPAQSHVAEPAATAAAPCDCASDSSSAACGCEVGCGCETGCCSSCGCSSCCCNNGWGSCLGDCCLGDAWTLQSCLHPCCDSPTYGGWISAGYYNNHERLSFSDGDNFAFNDFPDHLNLDQVWFYVEKVAEAEGCCADYGYRFDIMYGAQGHTAQAFGNDGGTWDINWDHGVYEWAIPQLYGEVAYGDWSWKLGHFFTPAGYEVVQATGNFFYSHALTHYNSEPFTHTGVLGTYSGHDKITLYTGWTLGWDTGFDQFGSGSIFLGGFGYAPNDNVSLTYILTAGNLGWRSLDDEGFSHHVVANFTLSECLTWVLAHDYVKTDDFFYAPGLENEDKSIVNYLIYKVNDCWSFGGRAEWWKSNGFVFGDSISFYNITGGINYRPHANLVVRPEIRYDWTPAEDTTGDYNQTWFGIDAVLTF